MPGKKDVFSYKPFEKLKGAQLPREAADKAKIPAKAEKKINDKERYGFEQQEIDAFFSDLVLDHNDERKQDFISRILKANFCVDQMQPEAERKFGRYQLTGNTEVVGRLRANMFAADTSLSFVVGFKTQSDIKIGELKFVLSLVEPRFEKKEESDKKIGRKLKQVSPPYFRSKFVCLLQSQRLRKCMKIKKSELGGILKKKEQKRLLMFLPLKIVKEI